MEQKYICFHEKIIFMSFETRNIEVVLYNLLKNVQCTMYFDHETFIHMANSIFQTPTKRSMGKRVPYTFCVKREWVFLFSREM